MNLFDAAGAAGTLADLAGPFGPCAAGVSRVEFSLSEQAVT